MADYSKYKYYKGEKENPFSNGTTPFDYLKEKFWIIESYNSSDPEYFTFERLKERFYPRIAEKINGKWIFNCAFETTPPIYGRVDLEASYNSGEFIFIDTIQP
jgi:hypothetical protein